MVTNKENEAHRDFSYLDTTEIELKEEYSSSSLEDNVKTEDYKDEKGSKSFDITSSVFIFLVSNFDETFSLVYAKRFMLKLQLYPLEDWRDIYLGLRDYIIWKRE